jgi:uncharacterized membrane protein
MTDQSHHLPPPAAATDERVLPIVAYATYLGGLITLVSPIIGVIIAHVGRDSAGPLARSHYDFLIRTFWMSIVGFVVTGIALGIGVLLSIILIGIPIVIVAGAAMTLVCVWFVIRSVAGLIYAIQNQPHPRPYTWLI